MTLRLVFMGSPDFAVPALTALAQAGHEIACVYSQPSRPAGRGQAMRPTPVAAWAQARGLDVRTPRSLRAAAAQADFAALQPDLAVVVAYGLILPQIILDIPRLGCVNVHGSLLPRWRGAAPIQRAIMAGDAETGVQIMQMEQGLDTGPVYATARTPIGTDETTGSLHDRLADMGARLLVDVVAGLEAGGLRAVAQAEAGVSYAHKITAADQRIDWSRPAREVDAQIRGLSPFPGAFFTWTPPGQTEPLRMKALMSEIPAEAAGVPAGLAPGRVLDDGLRVACGEGAVRITRLQRPGKGPVEAGAFLRGTPIPAGTVLE